MEESKEQIRRNTENRMRKNAFMLHNYIELESVEKDRAVFKLDIRPESCNPYGMVHGGTIYTLADNATGTAARVWCRSVSAGNTSTFCLLNSDGSAYYSTANYSWGVAPGFAA